MWCGCEVEVKVRGCEEGGCAALCSARWRGLRGGWVGGYGCGVGCVLVLLVGEVELALCRWLCVGGGQVIMAVLR